MSRMPSPRQLIVPTSRHCAERTTQNGLHVSLDTYVTLVCDRVIE